ncbi:MAG TPA: N-acetylmuramoyl-L-alanine amidase [Terriglobales bacterium]|nr:N-acetylmuramoyl-L-alanine amidase [Terriglobales bacterium]
MSATSIRVDGDSALTDRSAGDASLPLAEGNRVLESITRQESLGALLAFSELHERIRRQLAAGAANSHGLSQTESFFLDEVLQLICARAQTLTRADAVVVALTEATADGDGELRSRASAGRLPIPRGIRLNSASEFLQECLSLGRTLRCDDTSTDPQVEFDFAQAMDARSTVIVPLRGRSQRIGVLQAFASAPWSFTDDDVRCLDLFAELILAALRPEDQDRRFNWLADVADDVLQGREVEAAVADPIPPVMAAVPGNRGALSEPLVAPASDEPESYLNEAEEADPQEEERAPIEISTYARRRPSKRATEFRLHATEPESEGNVLTAHPGLSVVLALVAVAALFSAGVWWGMQVHAHSLTPHSTTQAAGTPADPKQGNASLVPVSTSASGAQATAAAEPADHLMDPAQVAGESPLSPVPSGKLAALPKITAVRHWASSLGSTVVIDMEDQVPYEVHRLMSPERIYFDLHDTALAGDLEGKTFDVGDPALSRVRVAQPVAGVTRIVLDTRGSSNFSVSLESDPYRLIVELREMPKSLLAKAPAADKNLRTQAAVEPTPIKTGKFRIVLDAGHGGWDLGTVGRQGLVEKDLVLDVTRRLGRLLHDRLGSDVMFTRTGDDYLPLEQRADFANRAQADLFVSVHANYSASATARGVETYYTNLFAAPGSKEIDKQANAAQLTPAALSAAGLRDKTEESRKLAASVQRALYSTLAAKSPDIRDRGTKDAAFVVLTGTTMPSILTEISFVSSPTDEQNLQSEAYRQQIAEALFKGIARYQESAPRARVAQLQTAAARR